MFQEIISKELPGDVRIREEIEVMAKARRRQFSATCKKRICAKADACTGPGKPQQHTNPAKS